MRTLAVALCVAMLSAGAAVPQTTETGLARLNFIVGEWRGTSSGDPGEGKVERVCSKVLHDRFELAEPKGDFKLYSASALQRVK